MFNHTNDFQRPASNGTRIATVTHLYRAGTCNRGEVIMNRIQKAAAAAMALAITLAGAAFVTAPMALADIHTIPMHQGTTVPYAQSNSSTRASGLRHG